MQNIVVHIINSSQQKQSIISVQNDKNDEPNMEE